MWTQGQAVRLVHGNITFLPGIVPNPSRHDCFGNSQKLGERLILGLTPSRWQSMKPRKRSHISRCEEVRAARGTKRRRQKAREAARQLIGLLIWMALRTQMEVSCVIVQ